MARRINRLSPALFATAACVVSVFLAIGAGFAIGAYANFVGGYAPIAAPCGGMFTWIVLVCWGITPVQRAVADLRSTTR